MLRNIKTNIKVIFKYNIDKEMKEGMSMLLAEINKKISDSRNINTEMEDVLTSNIFGVFKYLDDKRLMVDFLRTAEDIYRNKLNQLIYEITWEFYFWPKSKKNVEPDVLLQGFKKNNLAFTILIEAKYHSSKNIYDTEIESKDQLAEQYYELLNRNWADKAIDKSKIDENYLIFITNNYKMPIQDIEESITKIAKTSKIPKEKVNIYWTSWRRLIEIVDKNKYNYSLGQLDMIMDLRRLLKFKGIQYREFCFDIEDRYIFNCNEIRILKTETNKICEFDFNIDYIDFKGEFIWTKG